MHSFWDIASAKRPVSFGMAFFTKHVGSSSKTRVIPWILLLEILGLFSGNAFGQNPAVVNPKCYLGYTNGVNVMRFANVRPQYASNRLSNQSPKIGMEIGFIVNYAIRPARVLRLGFAASFLQLDYRLVDTKSNGGFALAPKASWQATFINFPVTYQIKGPLHKHMRPWMEMGLQPRYAISVHQATNGMQAHPFDLGILAGFGWDIVGNRISLSPSIRLCQGLRSFHNALPQPARQTLPSLLTQMLSLHLSFE
jgi:hypothetical protein